MANAGTASSPAAAPFDITSISPAKLRKLMAHDRHRHSSQPLLPGLPDHVAQFCLSKLHPSVLFSVCRSWRRLMYSPSFPPFYSLYALLSSRPLSRTDPCRWNPSSNSVEFFSFDPISANWELLPPPPDPSLDLMVRHPSFISRNLAVQSIAVSGKLVLLAATTHKFVPALPRPLIFCPISKTWEYGPPLGTPRRWCASGALQGSVYVASGIGTQFSNDVARSVEKWDLQIKAQGDHDHDRNRNNYSGWGWEKVSPLKDGRFSRDAIDAVGWRGKLCMVNVKGNAPKEGLVYDLEKDVWEEMPQGMIAGWRGPVAAMDEDSMFVVDEARGSLRRYNPEMDAWEEIIESSRLKGAVQIAAGRGRACIICGGSRGEIAVVDVAGSPPRLWFEHTPTASEVVALHVLPRMSGPKY